MKNFAIVTIACCALWVSACAKQGQRQNKGSETPAATAATTSASVAPPKSTVPLFKDEDHQPIVETVDLFPVAVKGKYGYMDRKGSIKIKPKYERGLSFTEGLAPIMDASRKWG